MKKDLLHVYVQNHLAVYYLPVLIVPLFLFLKFYLYGYPATNELLSGLALLSVSVVFYIKQNFLYRKILQQKELTYNSFYKMVIQVILNKSFYLIPWFLILFWPYQTDYILEHSLGFIFVFLSVAAYVSLSPPCLTLFISEILLNAFVASIILLLNLGSIEIPYIFMTIFIFTSYAFFIGRKLHKSAKELVNKNHELEKIAAEARQANMAKSDFLSMISHEIRTPMHGIMSTTEHLYETSLNNVQKDSLQVVMRCSKTLLAMLNDVLDISKIEAKKMSIEEVSFNLRHLINDAVNIVKFSVEDKNLKLICNIDDDVPDQIFSDPVRLQQIVLNLLNNAIKFTDYGSITVNVGLIKTSNEKKIRINVTDTGIGISKKNQNKLFNQFEQAEISTTRQYGGTGLGLSIAKQLVLLMGGDIGVESKEGEGSKFWFEVPCNDSSVSKNSERGGIKNIKQLEGVSVLVAEDNKVNQISVERILTDHKIIIDIVESGKEVLEKVANKSYDLILMDMNMPYMNGIKATQKLKDKGFNIPIVGLTATTEEKMISDFYDAGIVDHVTKPFSKNDLINVIQKNIFSEQLKISKSDSSENEIENKLMQMREDFGDEFVLSFVKDSLAEIDRLWLILCDEYEKKSYLTMSPHAHDICAVAGNIGMLHSYEIAKNVEKACLSEDVDAVPAHLEALKASVEHENKLVVEFLEFKKDVV